MVEGSGESDRWPVETLTTYSNEWAGFQAVELLKWIEAHGRAQF